MDGSEQRTAAQEGTAFAELVLGVEVSTDPPPPDSPLGRLMAVEREQGTVTVADVMLAREGLL